MPRWGARVLRWGVKVPMLGPKNPSLFARVLGVTVQDYDLMKNDKFDDELKKDLTSAAGKNHFINDLVIYV